MTHVEKLTQKAIELKKQNVTYGEASDSLYAFHKNLFLRGDIKAREQFNKENGLSEFARPEKSLWRVYEILDTVIQPEWSV